MRRRHGPWLTPVRHYLSTARTARFRLDQLIVKPSTYPESLEKSLATQFLCYRQPLLQLLLSQNGPNRCTSRVGCSQGRSNSWHSAANESKLRHWNDGDEDPQGTEPSPFLPLNLSSLFSWLTWQQKGDVLVTVPIRAMRGLETVSAATRAKLPPKMSIHGLLAADFLLNPPVKSWIKVIPTLAELSSIPFFWPPAAQELLPGTAKRLLKKQQRSFHRNWEQLQSGYLNIASEEYLYAWFVVSTRAFYQETRQTLQYPWHDRLALLPVADLFNHAAFGCHVSYRGDSYEIIADREYSRGDEVCTSYGDHSNDFLLAEYGFLLQNNPHDRFDPNDLITSEITAEDTALLKQMKTLAVLRQVCGPATEETLPDDGEWSQNTSQLFNHVRLRELLAKSLEEIEGHRQNVLALGDDNHGYQTLLLQRWNQIDHLVRKAMQLSTVTDGSQST